VTPDGMGLDLLLAQVREDEPQDDLFVRRVMSEVRQHKPRRLGTIRRPMIIGFAAATVAMGGAVAAFVGSNPDAPAKPAKTATVAAPAPSVTVNEPAKDVPKATAPLPVAPSKPAEPVKKARGYLSEHTAYAFDEKTGLRMETETYVGQIVEGRELRVTMMLENTGPKSIEFSAPRDCAMQARAVPAGGDVNAAYTNPNGYTGRMEWTCAGSDASPRLSQFNEKFVLAPGERRIADTFLALEAGQWNVIGVCRCAYKVAQEPTPAPKTNPLVELFGSALGASPELPELPDGGKTYDLATPPIGIRSS
jgi:hypothetical protein